MLKEATRLIESDDTVDLTSLCQWLGVAEDAEGYETAYLYAECIYDAADRFNKDLYLINSDEEKAVKEIFYG